MTGRVADRQEDRLALDPGRRERVGAPGIPGDRLRGMFAQVQAGGLRESMGKRYGVRLHQEDR